MRNSILTKINILILSVILIGIFSVLQRNPAEVNSENHRERKQKHKREASGAMESMQFMNEIRAYPDRDIPPEKYYEAYEYSNKYLSNSDLDNSADNWTVMGPTNIGGRSVSFAVHPVDTGTIFMGSASGGLWKSTTGGLGADAWDLVNTGYPSCGIGSIAIDSANPNIMYIGTGENYGYKYSNNGQNVRVMRGMYGIGILKTTNGGTTWTKSLDWSYQNQTGVWDVIINPQNSNILYAATSEGIYKSVNAGGNWSQILNYKMAMDLLINPVNPNILYASIGNLTNDAPTPLTERGIFKSTNAGVNWTKLTGGLPSNWSGKSTLDMYKGNPDYIYSSICNDVTSYVGFYKSTNGGLNWTVGSTSVPSGNQGWYNNGVLVKPDNPNVIVVGTLNVEKSTNGGTSFSTKSSWSAWNTGQTPPGQPEGPPNFVHADVHYYAYNPKDYNKLYVVTDGGLYRSNNFGESNSFYSCNGGFITSQFYASFGNSYQDSNYCIGGLQDNRSAFYQGDPAGAFYKTFVGDGLSSAVNPVNDNIVYTEYVYGDLARSTNRGVNWSYVNPPNNGSSSYYCFCAPFKLAKSNPAVIYIGSVGVYKSTASGSGWILTGSGVITSKVLSLCVSEHTPDTVYAGTVSPNASVFRTFNGGTVWTNISSGQLPDRYATDIEINPNDAKTVYITFGGFGTGHVYKSTNAGTNWTNISGNLPDLPHQAVIVDPLYPNNIYVGNDLGVYASTNGGQNWSEYRNGMPYSLVFELTISYPKRKLRATTHGNGVWQRNPVSNPLNINPVNNNIPDKFELGQNYPNPFNQSTIFSFQCSMAGNVKVQVYNLAGKEVSVPVNENLQPGSYNVRFDAGSLPSGVYFYRMNADGRIIQTNKMILMK